MLPGFLDENDVFVLLLVAKASDVVSPQSLESRESAQRSKNIYRDGALFSTC